MATPTVSGISPVSGHAGTVVVITGTNFIGTTAVTFGTTPATSFVVNSATQIAAVAPVGLAIPDITVTNASGTSATSSADQFTYSGYVPRDVVVSLTDFPWQFLVKNHNGIVTRTAVTDYSKATNRRNLFPPTLIPGNDVADMIIAPPAVVASPLVTNTDALTILPDDIAEAGGAATPPKPEVFTRVICYFGTVDAPAAPGKIGRAHV